MANVDGDSEVTRQKLESEVREMHLKEEEHEVNMDSIPAARRLKQERSPSVSDEDVPSRAGTPRGIKKQSKSPIKRENMTQSPAVKQGEETTIGGDVTLKLEDGRPPTLARTKSQKFERRPPALFLDYEDSTIEATSGFIVMTESTYANKNLGTTEHAMECECAEEYEAATGKNEACGEDSDCINRATKMECIGDCGCGAECQNQRFQRKQYANVSVIKTEKKGYGLRTNTNLQPDEFIFEYIGEVIGENVFNKRIHQYSDEGLKHFYFMSLNRDEFVDATRKGNLGRFCNHSCNPNCYVDKWVVGDRLRMGIFAQRKIQAGEELVFNYNVDRYGADAQPCYCGEPNCSGFIGGNKQTGSNLKLSNAIIEALGIDDAEAWDAAVAKKHRKKKASEDDEEYVNNVVPRGLDEEGVNKVMSSLMQCKEKWIAVKLLARIQRATDEKVRNRVVRFHGYRILKAALSNFIDDVNVCLQVLDVLDKMPRLTRNKIQDSKIEETVQQLVENEDARVAAQSKSLLESWSKLEVGYRIPRVKRDPNAVANRKAGRAERRTAERRRSRSRTRSKSPERTQAPTGPRGNAPQRVGPYFSGPRPPPRFRPPPPTGGLPSGWFEATAANGNKYYYNNAGGTTWQRPIVPAVAAPPPPPPEAVSAELTIQNIIKNIVATKAAPSKPTSVAPTHVETPKKESKEPKWRSLPEEKQKKLYEATLQPHIMHVVGKYKHKLAKEDLKRWAKELAKKIVDADFKKGRVEDPSKVSDKQAKSVKKHAQEFFEKALKKKQAADKRKEEKKAAKIADDGSRTPVGSPPGAAGASMEADDADITLSDVEGDDVDETPTESANSPLKRRREDFALNTADSDDSISKKPRTESAITPPPPPPPPPPGESTEGDQMDIEQSTVPLIPDQNLAVLEDRIEGHARAGAENELSHIANGYTYAAFEPHSKLDPMQTATPPTTGSPDHSEVDKLVKPQEEYAGTDPDRMRQLEMLNGASE